MTISRKSSLKVKFQFRFTYTNRLNNDFSDLFSDAEDILKLENLCSFCSRFIGNRSNYLRHMASHSQKHNCEGCQRKRHKQNACNKFAKRGKYLCDRCGHEFDQQPLFQQHIDSDHLNGDSIISSSLLNNDDRSNCLNQEEVSFANVP